jgi:hypothetical protein
MKLKINTKILFSSFLTLTAIYISFLSVNVKADYASTPVSVPNTFVISLFANSNMVIDKLGGDTNSASYAQLNDKSNPNSFILTGDRLDSGAYKVKLVSNHNICLTITGGLNPNQGNGTLAVFSTDCTKSLNLTFMNDNTIRISGNQNLCLTNQGNRLDTKNNRIHFWTCDNSPETKFNWFELGTEPKNQPVSNPVFKRTYTPQPLIQIPVVTQEAIKKSNASICHAPGTTYYLQTKYFTPFNTLHACLSSGGRMPKR